MRGSAKDGPTYARARIRNTVSTRGGAVSILETLGYVAQCGTVVSFARVATRRLRSRAALGLLSSMETDLGSRAYSTIHGSTDPLIAIGGLDRWTSKANLIHIGRRTPKGMVGVAGEERRIACVSDASTACVRSGDLEDTSTLSGGRYAKASDCNNGAGRHSVSLRLSNSYEHPIRRA